MRRPELDGVFLSAILAALMCLMTLRADAGSFREALRERAKEIIRENDKKESSSRRSSRKREDDSEKRSNRTEKKSSDRERNKVKEKERKRDCDDGEDRKRYHYSRGRGVYGDPFSYPSRSYVPAPYFIPESSYYHAPPPVIYQRQPLPRYYLSAEPYQTPRVIYPGAAPRLGASREVAVQVQSRLSGMGYYRGAIDGIVGGGTRRAIRAFQTDYGLPVTGRIDAPLLYALGVRNSS